MRTFSGKRSTLALAIAAVTAMSGWVVVPQASAAGFIDDSTLTGGIYYWQRERDRKDVTDGDKYKTNLSHSTWNANLDFQSGYAADMFGLDIAAFTAIEMAENGDSGHPNEIAFSSRNKAYDEDYSGDKSGISLYKAAAKFKYVRRGHVRAISSQPARLCWPRTGALCQVPIRGRRPGLTSTMARRAR
ncbi:N-acetylglucosamine-regulated outer membrane porin [Klebsiella variicola]|uniref:N-acetylglucosamine-regulated outer membrane porin n=1 Tax=Klebsiella variicola TaxID=244366 RepID=A0A7H4MFT4_KLEVA|nr:N-acetylglucosamine-regulated outer membrane porin [Klebsiella variicola]